MNDMDVVKAQYEDFTYEYYEISGSVFITGMLTGVHMKVPFSEMRRFVHLVEFNNIGK